MTYFVLSAVVFALLLGSFIFTLLPHRHGWKGYAASALFVVLIGVFYAGAIEALSRPRPRALEWRRPGRASVLGASLDEGRAIYLWLRINDDPEPRAYALPWSTETAEQLQAALREGRAHGTGVEVERPLGGSAEGSAEGKGSAGTFGNGGEPRFYAQPQQPRPPKTEQ